MPRVASKAQQRRDGRVSVHDLTDIQLLCRGRLKHAWEDDPSANWHTPRFDYINCYRYYSRCTRGCGCVKVAVYHKDGYFVTGFTRYPGSYRVSGVGRGAGARPFIMEEIKRSQLTPTGRKKVSDKARRRVS